MKKTLIALAAVAVSGAAFAQSSVTISGVVDTSLSSIKDNTTSTTRMLNDGLGSSNITFRGTEDLGNGLRAGFFLDSAISPDDGAGFNSFARRSILTLSGSFGEVRAGREYVPTFWNHSAFTAFGTNGVGASNRTFTLLGATALDTAAGVTAANTTLVRASNSLTYVTPNISGFTAQFTTGLNEGPGRTNRYNGLRVLYSSGPLMASIATGTEGYNAAVFSDNTRTNAGIAYDFGFIRPMFFYVTTKADLIAGGSAKHTQTGLGFTAPVGPGVVKFQYIRANNSAAGNELDANHTAIGYQLDLSKRTALYATYARISNKGATTGFSVLDGAGRGVTSIGGGNSSGYQVGLRHSF